jgi:DNA adenine methylase
LERDPNDARLWLPPHQGVSEVANDIHGELMNFWDVLKQERSFRRFKRWIEATPFSRFEHDRCEHVPHNWPRWRRAAAFFVRARQSRAGTFKGFTQLTRNRLRRGINGNASEWIGAVDGLAAIHARLQTVVLESVDALEIIRREDEPGTLFYLDPPYLHETRTATQAYHFEMTKEQHRSLLELLLVIKGKFMLSGYHSDLYDRSFPRIRFNCHEFELPNNAAGGKSKRRMTECLWTNF